MTDHESASSKDTGYEPDFVLSHRDVIHEGNWPDYEAQGFFRGFSLDHIDSLAHDDILIGILNLAKDLYGTENVYTGDAWSNEDGRPLHHKPGVGIYVHPNGRTHLARLHKERSRTAQENASRAG
jgi:hypothetical protein